MRSPLSECNSLSTPRGPPSRPPTVQSKVGGGSLRRPGHLAPSIISFWSRNPTHTSDLLALRLSSSYIVQTTLLDKSCNPCMYLQVARSGMATVMNAGHESYAIHPRSLINNQREVHLLLHGRLTHLSLHHSHIILPHASVCTFKSALTSLLCQLSFTQPGHLPPLTHTITWDPVPIALQFFHDLQLRFTKLRLSLSFRPPRTIRELIHLPFSQQNDRPTTNSVEP